MNQTVLGRRQFSVGMGAVALGGFGLARAQGEGRIVLGQSAAFTGPAAQHGEDVLRARIAAGQGKLDFRETKQNDVHVNSLKQQQVVAPDGSKCAR